MTPCNCNAMSVPHVHNASGIQSLEKVPGQQNADARRRAQNDYDSSLYTDDMVDPATDKHRFSNR